MPPFLQTDTAESITYLEDGSRIVISPVYGEDDISVTGAINTVTKSREAYCEDSAGNLEWKYILTATFSYDYGISSTCTNASYTQTIYDSKWSFSNGSAERSGNTAYGKGNYIKKELSLVLKSADIDISLTCDIYGNVK